MSSLIDKRRFKNTYSDMDNQSSARNRTQQKKKTIPQQPVTQGIRLDGTLIKEFMNNPSDTSMIGGKIMENHNATEGQILVTFKKTRYQKGLPFVLASISGLDISKYYSKEELFEVLRFFGISLHNLGAGDIPNFTKKIPKGETDTHGKGTAAVGGTWTITNGPVGVYAGQTLIIDINGDWEDGVLPKNYAKKFRLYNDMDKVDFIVRPYDSLKFKNISRQLHSAMLSKKKGIHKMQPLSKWLQPRYLNDSSISQFVRTSFMLKCSQRGIFIQGLRVNALRGLVKVQTPKAVKKDMLTKNLISNAKKGGSDKEMADLLRAYLKNTDTIDNDTLNLSNMKNLKLSDGSTSGLTNSDRKHLKLMETADIGLLKAFHKSNGTLNEVIEGVNYWAARHGLVRNPSDLLNTDDSVPDYVNLKWDDDMSRSIVFAFAKTDVERNNFEFPSGNLKPSITKDVNFVAMNSIPLLDAAIIRMKKNYDNRIIGTALENCKAWSQGLRFKIRHY